MVRRINYQNSIGGIVAVFREYRDIVNRIKGLDKPLASLTRTERNEVLNLSIRQEELEKEIGDQIRRSFKELQEGLDVVAEWVHLMQEDAIKALGIEGTPQEVLALEETLAHATSLNTQISALTLANYSASKKEKTESQQVVKQPSSETTALVEVKKPKAKAMLPVIHSSIEMVETSEEQRIIDKVMEEVNESVVAAAPTYLTEIFNQPRITKSQGKSKRKKR